MGLKGPDVLEEGGNKASVVRRGVSENVLLRTNGLSPRNRLP